MTTDTTAATGEPDLAPLVADGDRELDSLSDEQLEALWVGERLELEPDMTPETQARMTGALRSLQAAGYLEVTPSGDLSLRGSPSLVRRLLSRQLPRVLWVADPSLGRAPRSWVVADRVVVLDHQRTEPGIHHFTLRRLRTAMTDVVAEMLPAGPAPSSEAWDLSADDPAGDARLADLGKDFPLTSHVSLSRPLPVEPGVPLAETENWGLALMHGADGPGWMAEAQPDRTVRVSPIDRSSLRHHLLEVLRN